MTKNELIEEVKSLGGMVGLFAHRDDLRTALKDANAYIESIPAEGGARLMAYTAFYVFYNTLILQAKAAENTIECDLCCTHKHC